MLAARASLWRMVFARIPGGCVEPLLDGFGSDARVPHARARSASLRQPRCHSQACEVDCDAGSQTSVGVRHSPILVMDGRALRRRGPDPHLLTRSAPYGAWHTGCVHLRQPGQRGCPGRPIRRRCRVMSRRRVRGGLIAVALVLALADCQASGGGPDTAVGRPRSAVAGGRPAGADEGGATRIAAESRLDGLLGAGIGRALDSRSQVLQADTIERTLEIAPSGAVATWSNPRNGTHGTVRLVRSYRSPTGDYCREFEQSVTIGGRLRQSHETACRQADGTWRMQ